MFLVPTIGSLFSGIGGLEMGLEMAIPGAQVLWQCEPDPAARAVLEAHWPGVPRYHDVKEIDGWTAACPTVLCGGFPCQDLSVAGLQRGLGASRSGLWWEFRRIVRLLRPAAVFIENVAHTWAKWVPVVRRSLWRIGYASLPIRVSASDVGAPHRRARIFILAHPVGQPLRLELRGGSGSAGPDAPPLAGFDGPSVLLAHANGERLEERLFQSARQEQPASQRGDLRMDAWPVEPDVGGMVDGLYAWLDSHGGLGCAKSKRVAEALRPMWNGHVAQALCETVGGHGGLEAAALLQSLLCEREGPGGLLRQLLEGEEAADGLVRILQSHGAPDSPPLRRGQVKQRTREHSDAVRELSRLVAPRGATPWSVPGWEGGGPRVAHGVPARVDRLRLLGNACVPQQAALAWRTLMARVGT